MPVKPCRRGGGGTLRAGAEDGIECLRQTLADERAAGQASPQVAPSDTFSLPLLACEMGP